MVSKSTPALPPWLIVVSAIGSVLAWLSVGVMFLVAAFSDDIVTLFRVGIMALVIVAWRRID